MGRHVGFESWLERDHMMLLDFSPRVRAFPRSRSGFCGRLAARSGGMPRICSCGWRAGVAWWSMSGPMTGSRRSAHRALGAPVIVIWDNLNTHRSKKMREFTEAREDWLTVVHLPGYAPYLINALLGQTGLTLDPPPP
jgi:hypothetical protein